jgi:hypothetical protein
MSVHTRLIFKLLAVAACATAACPLTAHAVDNSRYVSMTGNDADACTLAAPCRTLQRGINVTPQGGELHLLNSANYGGNVNINRSMTISGNGHTLFLNGSLDINQAGTVVALRDLVLDGQGTVVDGIRITATSTVHIVRCTIHGFSVNGIEASADDIELFMIDSIVRANGGAGLIATGEASRLAIDNSHFDNNGSGVGVFPDSRAAISRSTASGNSSGLIVFGGGKMTVESSVFVGNAVGLNVANDGFARISNSTFTENSNGISVNGTGVVETRQNNTVRGNTNDVNGALTPVGGQ